MKDTDTTEKAGSWSDRKGRVRIRQKRPGPDPTEKAGSRSDRKGRVRIRKNLQHDSHSISFFCRVKIFLEFFFCFRKYGLWNKTVIYCEGFRSTSTVSNMSSGKLWIFSKKDFQGCVFRKKFSHVELKMVRYFNF